MKGSRVFLIMLACAFSISACGVYFPRIPKSIKNSFTYRYEVKYSGIDTLINIDGYYREMSVYEKSRIVGGFLKETLIHYVDTFYSHFMFYDNGIFVNNIRDVYYDDNKKVWIKKDVASFLKDFGENSKAPGANYFYENSWGGYIICGDTIKVQGMYKARSLNDSWHLREDWYKIIDKNTIIRINAFNLPTTQISQPKNRTSPPIIFFPISIKPPPDKSWILKEKWFWCNEEKWKEYQNK